MYVTNEIGSLASSGQVGPGECEVVRLKIGSRPADIGGQNIPPVVRGFTG